jgi:serine/threonine-protein kinase HipA
VLPAAKYEIAWRDCFRVVDQNLKQAEPARKELVERLLFNLLIGNGDAHGKNFALLFDAQGARLAPAYDLLCTQAYPALSQAFVMKVGPARRQEELAKEARVSLDWLKQRGTELCAAVQLALRELPSQILAQNPALAADIYPARRRDEFFRQLVDVMVGNCKRVGRALLARA